MQPTNPVLTIDMVICAAFVHFRKHMGVCQLETAKAIGMNQSGFSKIERGDWPFPVSLLMCAVNAVNAIADTETVRAGFDPGWPAPGPLELKVWRAGKSGSPISAADVLALATRAADDAGAAGVTVLFMRRALIPRSMQMRILGRRSLGIFVSNARLSMDWEISRSAGYKPCAEERSTSPEPPP
jgi:hypothetical protein